MLALVAADIAVRLLPSPRTTGLLGTPSRQPAAPDPAGGAAQAIRVGRMVERAAAALPWHPVCLPQALATRWLLRRRGIACMSHLGVVSTQPFSTHAWVTVGGTVVQGGGVEVAADIAAFT